MLNKGADLLKNADKKIQEIYQKLGKKTLTSLSKRGIVCEACGNTVHRDINASMNILERGLESFGLGISLLDYKQEAFRVSGDYSTSRGYFEQNPNLEKAIIDKLGSDGFVLV